MKPCDRNILQTIALTREMIRLADQGDAEREDVGCGVLYGILRDSAYKLRHLAEEERRRHRAKRLCPPMCPRQSGSAKPSATSINDSEKENHP